MHRKIGLVVTIVLAVVAVLSTSTALLVFDARTTGADALRTGGLAGGSIVALYALWINDRRRHVAEQSQQLARQRADHDRDRVADERFARAVELLGNEADQVRVGALHALAGLARSRGDYTQTVLDVLCSYLRRPFAHPRYEQVSPAEWSQEARDDAERMLVVRLTAQRLIADLLPAAGHSDGPAYDLDLTGATLEYFDLSGCRIGTLTLRYAHLYSSNSFNGCEFVGPAWFTGTASGSGRLAGRFRCTDAVFHNRAWFPRVRFSDLAWFDRTRFAGRTRFADSTFGGELSMKDAVFHGTADFRDCEFHSDVDLASATWHGEVLHAGITVDTTRQAALPESWQPTSKTVDAHGSTNA
jgi:uncharacterized protein YjbI with pentapeptide repeats